MNARLTLLHDDGEDLMQVFVHGYEGVGSMQDLRRLTGHIGAARPSGACYLLCWGSPLSAAGRVTQRLRAAAQSLARETVRGRNEAWLQGAGAAAQETLRFWAHTEQADRVGRRLAALVAEAGARARLRLWGHSLGARAVLGALAAQADEPGERPPRGDQQQEAKLENVELAVLLGAAAPARGPLWRRAASAVQGRLINVYSPLDMVLRLAPLQGPLAGLQAARHDRVENYETAWGHDSYWPRLNELIGEALPDFSRAASYRGLVAAACLSCQATLLLKPEQAASCMQCGTRQKLQDAWPWRASREA